MAENKGFLPHLDPRDPNALRRYSTVADFSDWQLGGVNAAMHTYSFEQLIVDFKNEKKGKAPNSNPSEK